MNHDESVGPRASGLARDELVAEVHDALDRVPSGARMIVAVSGGPDSTACAFLVAEARPDLVLVLAHIRHGLRDDRQDVAAVTRQASFLGVPLEVVDVAVEADGRGIEDAARQQRYAALRRVARAHEAGWLAVGHTADDQAETLVLRLARGTGIPGLAGMAPVRGDVVRPLLRLRRVDVHRFVAFEGLPSVHDPTNDDRTLTRNAVRHEVMPVLGRVGPDVVGALGRLADLARDDARALDDVAATRGRAVIRRCGPVLAVPLEVFVEQPAAISRRIIRSIVMEARGTTDPPSAAEVEALRLLDAGAMDLSGVTASASGGWWAVAPVDLPAVAEVPLEVPGATDWPALRWRIEVQDRGTADPQAGMKQLGLVDTWKPPRVKVDERVLGPGARSELLTVTLGDVRAGGLVLRPRAPGDRVSTPVGTRKLQDVMLDAGVPRALRDLWPVVARADGHVVWVPGLAVDAALDLAGDADPALQLVLRRGGR